MSRGTPHRTIRIPDEIWLPAKKKADAEGDHLSDVIRDRLLDYGRGIRIYECDDGAFVAADGAGWLPGVFATRAEAEQAARGPKR